MAASKAVAAGVAAYAVGINAAAAGLFYHDKQQALQHKWRVPERTLQATALAGGWIGGMWAMQKFRHKTQKQRFNSGCVCITELIAFAIHILLPLV